MKLLTHNLLKSNVKGAGTGFPLGIEVEQKEEVECEFDADFIRKMLGRLDWAALRKGAQAVVPDVRLPEALTPELKADEDFLRAVHHVLLEVEVVEGHLVCPDTGRRFRIAKGIPNMLLRSDEV